MSHFMVNVQNEPYADTHTCTARVLLWSVLLACPYIRWHCPPTSLMACCHWRAAWWSGLGAPLQLGCGCVPCPCCQVVLLAVPSWHIVVVVVLESSAVLSSPGQGPIVCLAPGANSPTGLGVFSFWSLWWLFHKGGPGAACLGFLCGLWRSLPGCCCLDTAWFSRSLHANSQLYPVFSVNFHAHTHVPMHAQEYNKHTQTTHTNAHTKVLTTKWCFLTVKLFPMFVSLLPLSHHCGIIVHLLSCFVVVIILSTSPPLFSSLLLAPSINSFHILSQ